MKRKHLIIAGLVFLLATPLGYVAFRGSRVPVQSPEEHTTKDLLKEETSLSEAMSSHDEEEIRVDSVPILVGNFVKGLRRVLKEGEVVSTEDWDVYGLRIPSDDVYYNGMALKKGDIVASIDGVSVRNMTVTMDPWGQLEGKTEAKVLVIRGREKLFLKYQFEDGPAQGIPPDAER